MKRHYKFHQIQVSFQGTSGTLTGPWAGKLMEALGRPMGENSRVEFRTMCGARFLEFGTAGAARLYFDEDAGGLEIEIEGNLYDVPTELDTIPEWDRLSDTPMPADPKEEVLGFFSFNLHLGNLTVNIDGADLPRSEMSDVARRIGDIIRAIS